MAEYPTLKETVEKYQLLAKKSLGQNFLLDTNITEKIVRCSLAAQDKKNFKHEIVYEVGPGPGGLTRAILNANPECLTVIEMDSRCIQIMQELRQGSGSKMEIIEGDALKYDFAQQTDCRQNIISNLPYNISVPLLIKWLKDIQRFDSLTLMFQKEVAERILAQPGHKNYGRLSVLAQLTCKMKMLMNLNPQCFVPAPKVWSTVLLLQPLENIPSTELLGKVEKLTELAFGQRRKMLRQSLKSIDNLTTICEKCAVSLTDRAENITPIQYLDLARQI